jgi:methionine synthase II (cobalamin-independent)
MPTDCSTGEVGCLTRREAEAGYQPLEIAAGIVDVKDPRVQTVAELCHLAEQLLTVVPAARLLPCP